MIYFWKMNRVKYKKIQLNSWFYYVMSKLTNKTFNFVGGRLSWHWFSFPFYLPISQHNQWPLGWVRFLQARNVPLPVWHIISMIMPNSYSPTSLKTNRKPTLLEVRFKNVEIVRPNTSKSDHSLCLAHQWHTKPEKQRKKHHTRCP